MDNQQHPAANMGKRVPAMFSIMAVTNCNYERVMEDIFRKRKVETMI